MLDLYWTHSTKGNWRQHEFLQSIHCYIYDNLALLCTEEELGTRKVRKIDDDDMCVCVCVYIYMCVCVTSRFTGRSRLTNWWMDPYFTDDLNPLLLKYGKLNIWIRHDIVSRSRSRSNNKTWLIYFGTEAMTTQAVLPFGKRAQGWFSIKCC